MSKWVGVYGRASPPSAIYCQVTALRREYAAITSMQGSTWRSEWGCAVGRNKVAPKEGDYSIQAIRIGLT